MRCCVPNCKNDSRHISKSQGITFHVFPGEATLRTAWLQAVGKDNWVPKERSAVCSEHFLCDDLYETKSGLRKVRLGAVPIILQDTNICDYGEPATLKVCRICLDVESKLFPIQKYKLEQTYEQLTGLSLQEDDRMPQKLCIECITRLVNYKGLRNKSQRAHSLMCEILKKHGSITMQTVKTVSRENNRLTSTLVPKYEVDHCTLHIDATEDLVKVEHHVDAAPLSIQQVDVNLMSVDVEMKDETVDELYFDVKSNEDHDDAQFDGVEPRSNSENELNDDASNHSADEDYAVIKVKRKKVSKKSSIKLLRGRRVKISDPTEPKIDRRRRPFLNGDLNETLFSITNLTLEEQVAEIQKRRESTNYKNATYKCTACFKGYLDADAYNSHSLRHTDQCGEFECAICKTHFRHRHALRKHITAHHTQRFSCNSCAYVTTHRQTARLHERWHKGTQYQCPHCLEVFVKFTTYMGHIRIKHPSDFVCELCGYSFVSEKGIELHKKLKHRLDNVQVPPDGPACETCNVKFVSEEARKKHLQVSARHTDNTVKETKSVNSNCRRLKKKEPRESKPREKKRERDQRRVYPSQMRKAEGPIPCEQCGLQLEDSRAYHGHFRRMHPDKNRTNYPSMRSPCMCEICGRIFQSYALLKDHRYVHTGEKPFKCDQCPKSFRMKQRLTAHRHVHAKVKASYVCAVCGKGFSTHSNRQRHMFIHTGLRPFKCEMCGKSFKHASEKRAHITYVHLKKPWPKRQRGKRQGQHEARAAGASGMEWPGCAEPKMTELAPMLDDKPMYYDLKI